MNSNSKLKSQKLLSDVCTIGIGGPAQYFVEVRTIQEMQQILLICKEQGIRYLILGKGSNCLFDDRGFLGTIIHNKIDFFKKLQPGVFHVGAGFSFALLGAQMARKGLAGLEFASGIPGTVGGAVFMNAGANGMETCGCLTAVDFVDKNGEFYKLPKEELDFTYRFSSFHHKTGAIVGATFTLTPGENVKKRQDEIINYRRETQPYRDKSAGCMFRNPKNGSAGALIEQCGLKGHKIGGAQVSPVHANFIINTGNGTSQEVQELLRLVKEKVKEDTGVELESEIRQIHYEGR